MQQNKISVKSPTRIDLAGGTLDCWPINALLSPVTTINVGISIMTQADLTVRDDSKIIIKSRELNTTFQFNNLKECLNCNDSKFSLFLNHINYWNPDFGFELYTQSDSPVGGGLGGSSSLSVSIFKSFMKTLNVEMDEYEIVRACSGIEAKVLKTPTGTQDYFPPIEGGINIIDYNFGWPKVQRLSVENLEINNHISIFYTGRSHHSGINNWQVLKKFIDGDSTTIQALECIAQVAVEMRSCILAREWEKIPELFKREFDARMDLAESFSSPEIEKLAKIAMENGGDAIKICGAGGGGCIFIWSRPENKKKVIEACELQGFKYLDAHLV